MLVRLHPGPSTAIGLLGSKSDGRLRAPFALLDLVRPAWFTPDMVFPSVKEEEMEAQAYPHMDILVRTRTGRKVHVGSPGSSVTRCGVWLKVDGSAMAVRNADVIRGIGTGSVELCENCGIGHLQAEDIEERYGRRYRIETESGNRGIVYEDDEQTAEPTPAERVEASPVFASFSAEARATIAANAQDAKPETPQERHSRARELVVEALQNGEAPLAFSPLSEEMNLIVWRAVHDMVSVGKDLKDEMATARRRMDDAERYINGESGVLDSYGILQSTGPKIDVLAATFRIRVDQAIREVDRWMEETGK